MLYVPLYMCSVYELMVVCTTCSGKKVSTFWTDSQTHTETKKWALTVYLQQQALSLPSNSLEVRHASQRHSGCAT